MFLSRGCKHKKIRINFDPQYIDWSVRVISHPNSWYPLRSETYSMYLSKGCKRNRIRINSDLQYIDWDVRVIYHPDSWYPLRSETYPMFLSRGCKRKRIRMNTDLQHIDWGVRVISHPTVDSHCGQKPIPCSCQGVVNVRGSEVISPSPNMKAIRLAGYWAWIKGKVARVTDSRLHSWLQCTHL